MIIWGGAFNAARTSPATDAGMYDPTTDTWSSISMVGAPSGRFLHSAVWTGDKMLIFGGTLNGVGNFNDMASYNPTTDSWATITSANVPSPRAQGTTVWTGSRMIIWSGYSGPGLTNLNGYISEGWSYDPVQNGWSPISVAGAPLARREATAVWTGNAMIVWSGIDAENLTAADPGKNVNDGGVYYP
jgi:N-acetylneuraminic acid mutarotase